MFEALNILAEGGDDFMIIWLCCIMPSIIILTMNNN